MALGKYFYAVLSGGRVGKDDFNGLVEEACDAEGERQRGVVFTGFDGVDGLAGNFEFLGRGRPGTSHARHGGRGDGYASTLPVRANWEDWAKPKMTKKAMKPVKGGRAGNLPTQRRRSV